MKKITFITMQLRKSGGIERFVSTMANLFCDNYQVEIIVNYGKDSERPFFDLSKNITLKYLDPQQPEEISIKKLFYERHFFQILKEPRRRFLIKYRRAKFFKKALKNIQTDVIITERAQYNTLVQKYYHGPAKLIATDHNFHQNNKQYISKLLKSLRGFNYLVVSSKELYDFYKNNIKDTACKLISIPLLYIPKKKTTFSDKNLISVGRLVPEKDFLTLIDVMKKVHIKNPKTKLFIIGNGKEYNVLKQKINENHLNSCVIMTGELSQEKIAAYYYKSSLYIMTSITEAFGLVLIEAMSYGLPIIAFRRALGAREQIANKTGVLIPNSNIDLMAMKIDELLNNTEKLLEYQANINSYIEKKYHPAQILALWRQLL